MNIYKPKFIVYAATLGGTMFSLLSLLYLHQDAYGEDEVPEATESTEEKEKKQ